MTNGQLCEPRQKQNFMQRMLDPLVAKALRWTGRAFSLTVIRVLFWGCSSVVPKARPSLGFRFCIYTNGQPIRILTILNLTFLMQLSSVPLYYVCTAYYGGRFPRVRCRHLGAEIISCSSYFFPCCFIGTRHAYDVTPREWFKVPNGPLPFAVRIRMLSVQ